MDKFRAKILLEQKRDQLHLESFMRHDNIQKSQPEDINPFDKFEEDIQKGKPAAIGETRMWGDKKMRKQANGKWVEVSEQGMTKKEHEFKESSHRTMKEKVQHWGKAHEENEEKKHQEAASKLSDKEYDDSELEDGSVKVYLGRDKQLSDLKVGDKLVLTEEAKHSKEDSVSLNIVQRKPDDTYTFVGMAGGAIRVKGSDGDTHILASERFEKKEEKGGGKGEESKQGKGNSFKQVKTVLGMKEYLTKKYGKDYKGSQLSDDEIDHLQDLKAKDKSGFMDFK